MDLLFGQISKSNTILHKVDPRVKLISLLIYIVVASTLKSVYALLAGISLMSLFIVISRTPFQFLLKRFLWVMFFGGVLIVFFPFITPGSVIFKLKAGFIFLEATKEGMDKAVLLFLRVLSGILALTVLNSTTGFREIINSLKFIRVPGMIVYLLEFTVRYIYVLKDELQRMRLARKSRGYDFKKSVLHIDALKTLSQMIAVLFLRSLERGERVFYSMLSRGYKGELLKNNFPRFKKLDLAWGIFVTVFAIGLKIAEVGGAYWKV